MSKYFASYRGKTATATDARVRSIAEIIDGIASVKAYGWEEPFFSSIKSLRLKERGCTLNLPFFIKMIIDLNLFAFCKNISLNRKCFGRSIRDLIFQHQLS